MAVRLGRGAVVLALGAAMACDGTRTGSAACGLAQVTSPSLISQQLYNPRALILAPPRGLPPELPARVPGERQGRVAVRTTDSLLALTYQGTGFPAAPGSGFALLVVDDTSSRVQGVVIYTADGPRDYPAIGYVTSGERSVALYGVRVSWADVSDPRCPLLGAVDSAAAGRP
jgi:hypothetical protein